MVQAVMPVMGSLAHPPLTSCCVARFLTGRGPVPVHGPGVGDPCVNTSVPHPSIHHQIFHLFSTASRIRPRLLVHPFRMILL